MKLHPITNQQDLVIGYTFYCPGCQSHHAPTIKPYRAANGASWEFNGDLNKPTFRPSILTRVNFQICHLFVTDGKIEYLSDCSHELAGKTVEMEPL